MTIVYGEWKCKPGNSRPDSVVNPLVPATLRYRDRSIHVSFLIDSGADRSLIVPEHQHKLGITDKMLQPAGPSRTLGGPVRFRFLTGLTLIFGDSNQERITLINQVLYFAPPCPRTSWIQRKLGRQSTSALSGKGEFRSILGCDVLQAFSAGWCMEREMIFLTNEHENFQRSVSNAGFWPPPSGDDQGQDGPDLENLQWFDGPDGPVII